MAATSSGRGQVVDDRVEHGLDALVLERGAGQDRGELARAMVARRMAALSSLLGQLLALEVELHDLRRRSRRASRAAVAPSRGLPRRARPGCRRSRTSRPCRSPLQIRRLHLHQVDDADEVGLGAHRDLQHQRGGVEPARRSCRRSGGSSAPMRSSLLTKQIRGTPYWSACRHTVSDCGSTPATPSNTATAPSRTRSERSTSTVKSTWPGVSMMLMVWSFHEVGRGGRDGDAALLLLLHPVHRRGALVDLTDLVVDAGVEQDPLGRRGLARVDVGHDPDVADLGQVRVGGSHCCLSSRRRRSRLGAAPATSGRWAARYQR